MLTIPAYGRPSQSVNLPESAGPQGKDIFCVSDCPAAVGGKLTAAPRPLLRRGSSWMVAALFAGNRALNLPSLSVVTVICPSVTLAPATLDDAPLQGSVTFPSTKQLSSGASTFQVEKCPTVPTYKLPCRAACPSSFQMPETSSKCHKGIALGAVACWKAGMGNFSKEVFPGASCSLSPAGDSMTTSTIPYEYNMTVD